MASPSNMARLMIVALVVTTFVSLSTPARADLAHFAPSFRGDSNTSYFGWDVFEQVTPHSSFFGFVLDDSTPDLGAAAGANMRQNNDVYGNVSGSGNIYSGFLETALLDATVTVPTNGTPGVSGFTTIILQITGNPSSPDALLPFEIGGQQPDNVVAAINGLNELKAQWWAQWVLPGNESSYDVLIRSVSSSMSIDGLSIDTIYSANEPVVVSPVEIVPEPTAAVLWLAGAAVVASRRRRK